MLYEVTWYYRNKKHVNAFYSEMDATADCELQSKTYGNVDLFTVDERDEVEQVIRRRRCLRGDWVEDEPMNLYRSEDMEDNTIITDGVAAEAKLTKEEKAAARLKARELKNEEKAAAKAAKASAPKEKRSKYPAGSTIHIVVDKNPKKAGSKSEHSFSLYKEGMTVEAYLKAGGHDPSGNIAWDVAHKFIEVIPGPGAAAGEPGHTHGHAMQDESGIA